MDFRAVALPIGKLMILIATFMLVPAAVDIAAGNPDWRVFSTSAVVIGCFGALTTAALSGREYAFRRREAFFFVNAAWLAFTLAGAIPLYGSSIEISFAGAFFEAASGLTTTGSTVLTGLDQMPPGILLWRSLLQWIGGIGIVVIGIWLLPGLRVGGSQLFALESSEKANKPYGRIEPFVARLMILYGGLTVSCTLLYMVCGMTFFQAINHAMTTVSTGGYSTSDSSFGQFQGTAVFWVAIVFMMLSALPFLSLIRFAEGKSIDDKQQIQALFIIVFIASFLVFLSERWMDDDPPFHLYTIAVFNVVSVITTTGYAAKDYLLSGNFVIAIFFLITFLGGCSGSTAGGFKMFRVVILISFVRSLLRRMVMPHRIQPARYSGKPVSNQVLEGILVFSILYAGTFAIFAAIYACMGMSPDTALSASITALANVGPGVGEIIGPSGTFQSVPEAAKWLLAIQMILGRLEIIGALLLVTPDFWMET
ncbi:TrkH family potassium uptake protein [Roseibium suaedae]|uniref:Trk system potassium uptake protein n=1 Tax=Roseibium suaedae TaxID=735517 RepID=A0A1M7MNB3_9HYPH|nr:TrkH family potassium uptake protein [Roseibium suaedae]SHM92541.1 trk system potassium uptake protein TrkH [Roseibium suaedae]